MKLIIVSIILFGITMVKGYAQDGGVTVNVVEHLEFKVEDNKLTFLYDYFDNNPLIPEGNTDRNDIIVTANCDWQLKITADAEYFTGPNGQPSNLSVLGLTIQDPTGAPYDNPSNIFDLLTRTGHEINELESGVTYISKFTLTWIYDFGLEPEELGNLIAGDYVVNTTYSLTRWLHPL